MRFNIQNSRPKIALSALLLVISYLSFALPANASIGISKPMNNLNLVGWWRLDEGSGTVAHDFSGKRNDGILSNFSNPATGVSGWANGRFGKSLNFDGGDDQINAGSNNSLNITSDGTIALWVNPRSYGGSGTSNILVRDNGSSGYIILIDNISITNGYSVIMGTGSSVDLPDAVVFNTWQHLVITKTGTTLRFYLNGVLANTGTSPAIGATGSSLYLGSDGTTGFFDGLIDDVRVYTRALSPGEVANLYKVGSVTIGKASTDTVTNGLVAHWSFDGKDLDWGANQAFDSVGGNTGSLVSMSASTNPTLGKTGQALYFDGVNDNVDVSPSSALNNLSAMTLSMFVKPRDVSAVTTSIITKRVLSGWKFGPSSSGIGRLSFVVDYSGTDLNHASVSNVLAIDQWQHVAMTWDGSSSAAAAKIYVNGSEVSYGLTTDATGSRSDDSANLVIMGEASDGTGNYNGTIDDMRIYNRVLSQSEIRALAVTGQITAGKSDATSMTDGLVGYWPMDGKTTNWGTNQTTDVSGRSSNALMVNMSTTTSPALGKIGQAFNLDGITQYLSAGNVPTLDMGTNNWTASAWVKIKDTSGNPFVVGKLQFTGGASPDAWGMELLADGTIRSLIFQSGGTSIASTADGATVNDGKWHHIATTWTRSGNMLRYVDGVVTGTADNISAYNGVSLSNTRNFIIGARDVPDLYFPGSIDDVRVYNRALSASDVKKLYNLGR